MIIQELFSNGKASEKVQSTFSSQVPNSFGMRFETLDYIFPFVVFFYGIVMVFVLENQSLQKLANERMPAMGATLRSHKNLAWVCLFVGGLWSLQNVAFS